MTPARPPLFVIGSPRSGTTLLRLMLTCHPNIVIPPECGFAVWLRPRFTPWPSDPAPPYLEAFSAAISSCRKFEGWNLSQEELSEHLRLTTPTSYADATAQIYLLYAQKQGRTVLRWGDKNNFYLGHIDTLAELFPQAFFIHIVRDGRDVATSYRALNRAGLTSPYAPRLPDAIPQIARRWVEDLETIRQSFLRLPKANTLEVRYEDLVRGAQETLSRICERVGEVFSPRMLRYDQENRALSLVPPFLSAWKAKTFSPPDTGSIGRYHHALSPEEVSRFNEIAEGVLRRYDY